MSHTTSSTEDPGTKDHHISEPEKLEGAEVKEDGGSLIDLKNRDKNSFTEQYILYSFDSLNEP